MNSNAVCKTFSVLVLLFICTSCSNLLHKKVTIIGMALNEKGTAVVQTDSIIYLLDKVDNWDKDLVTKKVAVTGQLKVKTYKTKSTSERAVQERVGKIYILRKPEWRTIE